MRERKKIHAVFRMALFNYNSYDVVSQNYEQLEYEWANLF